MDRLNIMFDIYREPSDLGYVLVCYSQDYHAEQKHLLQNTSGAVSCASVVESLSKIISRIVERSVFNDASPPGTVETVQSEAQTA